MANVGSTQCVLWLYSRGQDGAGSRTQIGHVVSYILYHARLWEKSWVSAVRLLIKLLSFSSWVLLWRKVEQIVATTAVLFCLYLFYKTFGCFFFSQQQPLLPWKQCICQCLLPSFQWDYPSSGSKCTYSPSARFPKQMLLGIAGSRCSQGFIKKLLAILVYAFLILCLFFWVEMQF